MRRIVLRSLMVAVAGTAAVAVFILVQLELGNFHEVIPGELYRSAQPDTADIEEYAREHGIKSIINLRGGNPDDAWYRDEVATSKALGITHIDFRMKAARELTHEQVVALIDLMRNAPKPLLIHCRSGADRTGLASAFYIAGITKGTEWAAERQLWMIYGHLPFPFLAAQAMDRTFERLEPYFGYTGS